MTRIARCAAFVLITAALFGSSCADDSTTNSAVRPAVQGVALLILGTAQDAGAPQLACRRACCERLRTAGEHVPIASAALIDTKHSQCFLFDATPDLRTQLDHPALLPHLHAGRRPLDGIFLTHAHIGHYLGLAYLGRESLAADDLKLYATPRMKGFLEQSGPWNLLIEAQHAHIDLITPERPQSLHAQLSVTPFLVPHRDEYSDTVGYRIAGPQRTAIYLPDVDRIDDALWTRLLDCDVLLLDGTFFADGELAGRDMSAIPHPRMRDTLARWSAADATRRPELWFVHLNHTNPALDPASNEARIVRDAGARIARVGDVIEL